MHSGVVQRRAVRTFFTDTAERVAGGLRVCRGLSCELNGAASVAESWGAGGPGASVYCLGMCDRSPAIQFADGRVACGSSASARPESALAVEPGQSVDVRNISRRAVVTERLARGSHAALTVARRAGAYEALGKALRESPSAVLARIEASGEQGRGGAGYPTGRKWRACAEGPAGPRCVIANGDEGDPGSFVDRLLLEDDPHSVLEGLMLCGWAVGAHEGIIFIRAEYPQAQERMRQAIVEARAAGLLGAAVMGYPFAFDARVVAGHGSYVCGEETALLNAIEGRRGDVRVRPPYPAQSGLHGRPTVVNNIETLVNIPWIVREGADAYRALGTPDSPGTKAFCLNRGFARPGIVEAEFGVNLRELIEVHAGGSCDRGGLAAIALGGPMGSVLVPARWDIRLDYPELNRRGIRLGHGGIVAIPAAAHLSAVLLNWVEFMAAESCGKCAPCGLGSRQALDLARRLCASPAPDARLEAELTTLMATVQSASLCGFGQGIAGPILTLVRLFMEQQREGRTPGA